MAITGDDSGSATRAPVTLGQLRRSFLRLRTLADCFDSRADNFLLLRFVAAVMVMFGHSYAFTGLPNQGDFIARAGWGNGVYTGSIAVDVFFVISGLLVTGSYLRRAQLEEFLKSRALRILPAYAACMVGCAIVLGAIFSTLPLSAYWTDRATYEYIYVNMQFGYQLIWNLPGVFVHNFYPNAVNGAIWTLPAEARMYCWVAILGALAVLRRRWLANTVFAVLLLLGLFAPDYVPLVPKDAFVRLAGFFLLGAFCFVNRDWVRIGTLPLLGLIVLAIGAHHTAFSPYALGLAIAYASLWFAYVPSFHFFNRFGDYSYGIYLWGFPIQQAVSASLGRPVHAWVNLTLSLPIVIALAVLSWHLIEKPALRLKQRVPQSSIEMAKHDA
ncbi:MAG: acyltransferase [Rudaea sp.]